MMLSSVPVLDVGRRDLGHYDGPKRDPSVEVHTETLGSVMVDEGDLVLQGVPTSLENLVFRIGPSAVGGFDRGNKALCVVSSTVVHAFLELVQRGNSFG